MQFLSATQASNQVQPYATVPEHLRHHLIPGFLSMAYPTDFGEVLTQSRKIREFRLTIHHIIARTDGSFQPTPPEAIHTIHYMFSGSCSAVLNGKGPVSLTEGEYNRFFVPASRHSAYFLPGEYCCIHLDLTPALLERYPRELHDFIERMRHVDPEVGVIFDLEPIPMVHGEREILQAVSASRLTGGVQRKFMYQRCVELFHIYLLQHYRLIDGQDDVVLSDTELANLHAAQAWMVEHLYADVTVAGLAASFNMSDEIFSRGFYKLFGQSIPEFLHYRRMGYAGVLLVERNFSIADILVMVNYPDRVRFEADIHEFYGKSIEELRREFPLNP